MTNASVDSPPITQTGESQQSQSADITVTITDVEHREVMQALERAEHAAQGLADTPGASSQTILAAREAVKTIQSAQEKLRRAYLLMWADD